MGKKSRKHEKINLQDETIEAENEKNRRQKKLINHSLKLHHIKPKTDNQEKVFRSWFEGKNVLMSGFAGTGKTLLALYLSLNDLFKGHYKKIIICRSAYPVREIGHLPGTLEEKIATYETPYISLVGQLCSHPSAYEILKKQDVIEFCTTSFLRGQTFDDSVVIIDECQSMTLHETDSIITRLGSKSKIIIAGDLMQDDLSNNRKKEISGFGETIQICSRMSSFDIITFEIADIVRGGIVKEWLLAKHSSKKY